MTFAGQSDEATSMAILDRATDAGITFIDTADVYPLPVDPDTAGKTEAVIGKWLQSHKNRDAFVLASKCRMKVGHGVNDQGLSRRHIIRACEASLKRLQTDYLDLFYAHSPDPETPIEESLRAFEDLVRSGKVRYVGCSNFPAWQVSLSLGVSNQFGLSRFECVQPRYNILYREIESELLPLCRDQGLGVAVYNPIAGGLLSGKHADVSAPTPGTRFAMAGSAGPLYRERYWHQTQFEAVHRLKTYFDERNIPLAKAAVAWTLCQPGITSAIIGASRPDQLDDTLDAVNLVLSDQDLLTCDDIWWGLPRRN
jgi:aryl-alcohol dehydrogenase-like predicted oxidoreductase